MTDRNFKLVTIRLLSKIASSLLSKYYWTWATITKIKKNYQPAQAKKMVLTITSNDCSPKPKRPLKKPSTTFSVFNSDINSRHLNLTSISNSKMPIKALTPTSKTHKSFSIKSRTPTKKYFQEPLAIVSANLPTSNIHSMFSRSITPNY